jgi:hypothetical protein
LVATSESNVVQIQKKDIAEDKESEKSNEKSSRSNSPKESAQWVPPTKDEIMLFGECEENPLMKAKKAEA